MVLLFGDNKNKILKEISEILTFYGANHITDSTIEQNEGQFTLITKTKPCNLKLNNAVAIVCTKNQKFKKLQLSKGVIGICEENDRLAFEILAQSSTPVIVCGMNQKNTVTLSSINENSWLISIQRNIPSLGGGKTVPSEYKIKLRKEYSQFSVLASVTVLIMHGIKPYEI